MPCTHQVSRRDLPKTEWRRRETEQGSEPPGAGSASLSRPLDHALEERTDRQVTRLWAPRPRAAAFLSSCFHVSERGPQLL